jgi:hypothetical protein
MLIKTNSKKETASDYYGADNVRNYRYGFFLMNRRGTVSRFCCEKCAFGSGKHADFCNLSIEPKQLSLEITDIPLEVNDKMQLRSHE